ncbi:hypothetical protein B0H19DRAFT_1244087, partial [Mycena capillaripes]
MSTGPNTIRQRGGGTVVRLSKTTSAATTDWLGLAIQTANTVAAAAECLPHVKGVFATVVIFLETVEQVHKNRKDLKDLCESIMEMVAILGDEISSHPNTAAVRLKGVCQELERILQRVLLAVKKLQHGSRGFRGHLKEFIKSSSIKNEVAGYQKNIQTLCSKLKVCANALNEFAV